MTLSKKSVAVVTGAGSGIGQALALRFAQEGIAGIAIADLNEKGLEETFSMVEKTGVPVSKHVIDVSKLAEIQRFADEVIAKHGYATHLVNNAGVGVLGTFQQLSLEDFEWLMNINFWGVVYGCNVFLPILLEQDSAHIVNISSVFGMIAPPEQTAYCASKFAVRGFTESLRHELQETNVRVSSVHPGGIKTNIARNSRIGKNTPEEYKKQGVEFFDKVAQTSPEKAADVIVKGIKAENPRILIGADAKAINIVQRLFPKKYLKVFELIAGHKLDLRKK
ncbi:MAG: SDR family NAD(P)-dependent oxidoreductase [Pyrinomonadaceae bacterium]|nr:SDR family NAD(P)-dependent oxidoreductase [Pyrinomonadaceae bacterium]